MDKSTFVRDSRSRRPNIILIVADQLRGDSLGCAGHPDIDTPTYDRLAAEGVRFSRAYSPNPICVPARATMITGRLSHKCTGRKSNGGAVRDGLSVLPGVLAESGYATYAAGKLHYVPYSPPGTPRLLHGFQEARIAESGRVLKQHDPSHSLRGVEDYADYLSDAGWAGYTRPHGIGNNDIHPAINPLPEPHLVDSWVASTAVEFISGHARHHSDDPFFLHVGYPKPHPPFDPPIRFGNRYDPRTIQHPARNRDGRPRTPTSRMSAISHGTDLLSPQAIQVMRAYYYGLTSFQDEQTARILAALSQWGLDENTVVIFTADHGEMLGDFGFFFKSCMYEGSANIPLIIRMPESINGANAPNRRSVDKLVGLEDLMPTICELAGVEYPTDIDGRSVLPLLNGDEQVAERWRSRYVAYSLDSPGQTAMVTDGTLKYVYNEMGRIEEFYDLASDPREEYNLVGEERYRSEIADFRESLVRWAIENDDTQLVDGSRLRQSAPLEEATVQFRAERMGWRWY